MIQKSHYPKNRIVAFVIVDSFFCEGIYYPTVARLKPAISTSP